MSPQTAVDKEHGGLKPDQHSANNNNNKTAVINTGQKKMKLKVFPT